jgi:hypothetical protein
VLLALRFESKAGQPEQCSPTMEATKASYSMTPRTHQLGGPPQLAMMGVHINSNAMMNSTKRIKVL